MARLRRRFTTIGTIAACVGSLVTGIASAQQDAQSEGARAFERSETGRSVVSGPLMWAAASNGEDVPWAAAYEYCETLELDGYEDWRLPALLEIERLHDPDAGENGFIMSPIELGGCCLWSGTSLADLAPEEGGVVGGQRGGPTDYHWGFLYDGGIRYYSSSFFPDGQALCVRERGDAD